MPILIADPIYNFAQIFILFSSYSDYLTGNFLIFIIKFGLPKYIL